MPEPGTVIRATHRNEDLIPAFLEVWLNHLLEQVHYIKSPWLQMERVKISIEKEFPDHDAIMILAYRIAAMNNPSFEKQVEGGWFAMPTFLRPWFPERGEVGHEKMDYYFRSRDATHDLERLFEILNEPDVAPPCTTFGAHEGDGSDYGFWPIEQPLLCPPCGQEAQYEDRILHTFDELPEHVMDTDESGKVVCYSVELREEWSLK